MPVTFVSDLFFFFAGLAQPRNIDIFVVQYPSTANGIINGEARFPWTRNPTINLVMAVRPGVVSRNFNTIAHEMGHVFGMFFLI